MKPKKKNRMLTDLARFGHGFVYAWHGICAAVLEERNFRFHLCAALYVFAAAHMAHIDATGVALLAICVFMMLGMELMNSAVERAVDKPDTTHWWSAGAAKDMAAGLISDVAIQVGFNTPKYFSKCFKKEFGIFPKESLPHDAT